jgi:transcription elongation factor Elf1
MKCRVAFSDANKVNTHIPSKCDNCGESIILTPWDIDHYKHHFCSPECHYTFFLGEGNPNYGKVMNQDSIDQMKATKKKNYKKKNHPLWGKHHSKESKEKMRIAHLDSSEETRAKMRASHPRIHGEAHHNWRGGLSLLEFEEAYGIEMRDWDALATKVRERDKYTCQFCGAKHSTSVHHIRPRRYGIDNSMDNLITLCTACHPTIEHKTNEHIAKGIDPIALFYDAWSK